MLLIQPLNIIYEAFTKCKNTHDMLNEENQRTKLHVPYKLNLKKKQHI